MNRDEELQVTELREMLEEHFRENYPYLRVTPYFLQARAERAYREWSRTDIPIARATNNAFDILFDDRTVFFDEPGSLAARVS